MHCTDPRTVGFYPDGKTLCWSPKKYSKEFATFQLPCGQCVECRLDYARQWAIRCVHESKMYKNNCFITLTYSDEKLTSPRLQYSDFQKFMKKLRKLQTEPMGMFVTGEYGERTKRPHWHAIIFNWSPPDLVYSRTNDNGDKIYNSATLDRLWGNNDPKRMPSEIGDVTFKSAGYCARYAAKKLAHGKDQDHDFHPISKKSSKHAIGKKFLERYWTDIFSAGRIIQFDGTETSIPRYYEKWLKENQPSAWEDYIKRTKLDIIEAAQKQADIEKQRYLEDLTQRRNLQRANPLTTKEVRKIIQQQKFNILQNYLKF